MAAVRPLHPARRDVLAAIAAFWAITSLVFTIGRWFIPGFSVSGVSDRLDVTATDSELREARLFDLQTAMAGPPYSPAAMDATGAIAGRTVFEHLDGFGIIEIGPDGEPWPEEGCDPEGTQICRYNVNVRTRADVGGVVLLISASDVALGTEVTSGFSLTVSAPGLTFNSKPGRCTLALTAIEPYTPRVAGWASCTGLTELRSGAILDFLAAFDAIYQSRF